MSTTDHSEHPNSVAPHCPTPVLDPISVLRDAVATIATLDHTTIAEATDQLLALAHTSGHHPLCVACEVAHLVDPTGHPHTHPRLGANHQRWTAPPYQRQHPPHQVPARVPARVWAIVLAAAAPTRPTPTPPPPNPAGRTPGRTLNVAGRSR